MKFREASTGKGPAKALFWKLKRALSIQAVSRKRQGFWDFSVATGKMSFRSLLCNENT